MWLFNPKKNGLQEFLKWMGVGGELPTYYILPKSGVCQAINIYFTQLKLFVIPSVLDRIFWLCLAFVLDSFGDFYKNRSSTREISDCANTHVCGVKLVDVVKVQIGVNREEPTDAFSSIREEFS